MSDRAWRFVLAGVIGITTILAYSSSFSNGFVWDDHQVIEKGHLIGSLRNLPELWVRNAMWNSDLGQFAASATVDTYRPMALSTYIIVHALVGKAAWAYHIFSVLLHSLNAVLLAFLGMRLGLSRGGALVAGMLFGLHPAIGEATHWINGISDPWGVMFVLLGLSWWLKWIDQGLPRTASPILIAVMALGAAASKETTYMLIAPLGLLGLGRGLGIGRTCLTLLPWLAGLAVGFGLRVNAIGRVAVSAGGDHVIHMLLRAPVLWTEALASFFFPRARLEPSLYERFFHFDGQAFGIGIAIAVALLGGTFWLWRKHGDFLPFWALVTLFITLAPVGLLTFKEGWSGWGRYLYPAAGPLCMATVGVLDRFGWPRVTPRLQSPVRIVMALALALFAFQTFVFGFSWKDDRSFAVAQIEDAPGISVGYSELSHVEARAGRGPEARVLAEKAVALAPYNAMHRARLAFALSLVHDVAGATRAAEVALRLDPQQRLARYIRALGLLEAGLQVDAAHALVSVAAEDHYAEGVWSTIEEARNHLGPTSPFVATLTRLARLPENRHISIRLLQK